MRRLSFSAFLLILITLCAYSFSTTPTNSVDFSGRWWCDGVLGTSDAQVSFREDGKYEVFIPIDASQNVEASTIIKGQWRFARDGATLILSPRTLTNSKAPGDTESALRFAYESEWALVHSKAHELIINAKMSPAYDARLQEHYPEERRVLCQSNEYINEAMARL